MPTADAAAGLGGLLDKRAQPQMSGLIVEPAMPKHPDANSGRYKGKPADRKAVCLHPVFGEAAAEHRHHIGAGQDGRGRETGGAVRDVPGQTSRAERSTKLESSPLDEISRYDRPASVSSVSSC